MGDCLSCMYRYRIQFIEAQKQYCVRRLGFRVFSLDSAQDWHHLLARTLNHRAGGIETCPYRRLFIMYVSVYDTIYRSAEAVLHLGFYDLSSKMYNCIYLYVIMHPAAFYRFLFLDVGISPLYFSSLMSTLMLTALILLLKCARA